jgi:oligopeptide/dipeptide ABC transporter ATP-binding protein
VDDHLRIRELNVGFRTYEGFRQVLEVDELTIHHGESYGLVGESGAGKTVLALAVLRLLRAPPAVVSAGELSLDGEELLGNSERRMRALRGREISMIFQDPMSSLNPVFTVGKQLTHVIHRIGGEDHQAAILRAQEMIRLVGLPDAETMMDKYPHQLSGGQRQRVIIALALACGAHFLIADEPTRNLDVTVQAGVLKTIAALRRDLGVSVLFIANNLGLVAAMCDRVGILMHGRIVETGTVDEVVFSAFHPYTRSLLRAIPTKAAGHEESESQWAQSLSRFTTEDGSHCSYFTRCTEGSDVCAGQARPELTLLEGTHYVACRVAAAAR